MVRRIFATSIRRYHQPGIGDFPKRVRSQEKRGVRREMWQDLGELSALRPERCKGQWSHGYVGRSTARKPSCQSPEIVGRPEKGCSVTSCLGLLSWINSLVTSKCYSVPLCVAYMETNMRVRRSQRLQTNSNFTAASDYSHPHACNPFPATFSSSVGRSNVRGGDRLTTSLV